MGNWANDIAKEFKDRNNPKIIGMVIGEVLSPPPSLKISCLEGQVIIRSAYIFDFLLKDCVRQVEIATAAAEGSTNSAACSDGPHSHKIVTAGIPNTNLKTLNTLKIGDKVIVYTGDNQNYFILGKVVKVGG